MHNSGNTLYNALHMSANFSIGQLRISGYVLKIQCKQDKIPYREVWKQK